MRIGYGAARLDVPVGSSMGGYIDRVGKSTGTLDPLEVSAITWFDGHRRFALVVADVICVNTDLVAAARAAVPEAGRLWLAATHTHAGPETGCVPGGSATPQPWSAHVVGAVRHAVAASVAAERSAWSAGVSGGLRDVGADRSLPGAEAVVPLDVAAVRDGLGRLTGVLVVLPVHPTVLPAANRRVSADLPGAVRRALRERLGVWVVVATGAAGDISTRHTRRGQDAAELERLGELVADRCVGLLGGADRRATVRETPEDSGGPGSASAPEGACGEGSPGDVDRPTVGCEHGDASRPAPEAGLGRVAWAARECVLPRAAGPGDPAALLADLRAAYEESLAAGDPVAIRMARSRLEGARVATTRAPGSPPSADAPPASGPTADLRPGLGAVPEGGRALSGIAAEVGVARLGGLTLVALPGEPFLAVRELIGEAATPGGERAHETLPASGPATEPAAVAASGSAIVLGYANGYPGYLPTREAYLRGEYEVLAARVAAGSAELLATTARELLEET
ncbi:hypothetical protein [Rhizohabitans arisaemae]|uniref:hypothetical protein n=1 Tax=Rhizohabitans arisaemae TaxID=2720610 RepID=UPI0024B23768|nr:hypothetical protein [Rhizohabitans arisaemae]